MQVTFISWLTIELSKLNLKEDVQINKESKCIDLELID